MGFDIPSLGARLAASGNLDPHLFTVALWITGTASMTPKSGPFPN
jgi:hypothetical protein